MKKINDIFKAKDLYFALCFLETGQEINSFKIYENEENSKEIRFGPLKISALDNNNIIDKILLNEKIKNLLDINEINYLDNIKKTANALFNAKKSILKNLFISRKKLQKFLFKSNQNRILYKNIFKKIIFYLYKKNEYKLDKLYINWSVFNNNFYNDKIEKFKLYLKNPNYKIISNISSVIQQYNYEKKFFDNNFLYQEKENIKLCAYHIRIITNQWVVSAWNCHSIYRKNILYSSFQINFDKYKEKYIDLFNRINREPWKNYEQEIKNIIVDFIPEKKEYIDYLQEGNIVGLFNQNSSWNKVAFFEAINDRILFHFIRKGETIESIAKKYECSVEDILKLNNMKNIKLKLGNKIIIKNKNDFYLSRNGDSYFELDKKKWTPSDITKQEKFTPIKKKFNKDNAFAFNTHIGIIVRHANKIMILHYVYGFVILSPIEKLKPVYSIMWIMKLQKT